MQDHHTSACSDSSAPQLLCRIHSIGVRPASYFTRVRLPGSSKPRLLAYPRATVGGTALELEAGAAGRAGECRLWTAARPVTLAQPA